MKYQQKMHNCKEELNELNLKATPVRLAMLSFFENTNTPSEVSAVLNYLRQQDVPTDQATVYRVINALTEKGLLKRVELQEGKFRYELSSLPHHHHMICTTCGTVSDIEDCDLSDIEKKVTKQGFKTKSHSLEFFGVCKRCQL